MSKVEGEIEEISEKSVPKFGRPMVNITVGGVRMGKFFKDDNEYNEFLGSNPIGLKVVAKYSVNGKWKNLESLEFTDTTSETTQETLDNTDNKIAKAALKVASAKTIKDGVTGKDWSRDTVVQQIRKDVKNIREMLESMKKLVEVL